MGIVHDELDELEDVYFANVKPIRCVDENGNIASYDPNHPWVIEQLRNGGLTRSDN